MMALINRERERKISVSLEQMAEEFMDQLELQRKRLEEDYVGFSRCYICRGFIFPFLEPAYSGDLKTTPELHQRVQLLSVS